MSLEAVILGILRYGPKTGYQLKQTIDETVSFFWTASFGGLYPALKRLKGDWAIEEIKTEGKGKPYKITKKGRERFKAWLKETYKPRMVKDEFLLKLFLAKDEEVANLSAQINKRLAELDELAENLKELKNSFEQEEITLNQGQKLALEIGIAETDSQFKQLSLFQKRGKKDV